MTDEYIRREDAVNALKAQADTMRTWAERYDEQRRGVLTAVNIVEDIEPADVVQVVRCKDCERCEYDAVFEQAFGQYWCRLKRLVKSDDFCSYGKRKG